MSSSDETSPLRVLMCGDRNWVKYEWVEAVVATFPPGTIVIEGEARGADLMSKVFAEKRGFQVLPYPADWKRLGKGAGNIRNQQMIDEGNPATVIYFHDDLSSSTGTADMVERARKSGLKVYSYEEWLDENEGNRTGQEDRL